MLILLLATACLIDHDLYEERRAALADADGDGALAEQDCDDHDATSYPGAAETCDGRDNDCDGQVDDDAEDRLRWYLDSDGDGHGAGAPVDACAAPEGHASTDDDCDDEDASVHPSAEDSWYDGVDSDCAGDDDFDQDGDGDASAAYGGGDCDDEDVGISSLEAEGWIDLGVDNDCDGSIDDAVVIETGSAAAIIAGPGQGAQLGAGLRVLPAAWSGTGEVAVLAAAPAAADGAGGVWLWSLADLHGGEVVVDDAAWAIAPDASGEWLGFGLAAAGSESEPVTLIASPGASGGDGRIDRWRGGLTAGDPSEPDGSIYGVAGSWSGLELSAADLDGDGLMDVVVSSPLDSRNSTNAGSVSVLLDPASLPDGFSVEDADRVWTSSHGGGYLDGAPIGDADGDGLPDVGLTLNLPGQMEIPGGAVVSGTAASGDVEGVSDVLFYGGPFIFGEVRDVDGDGASELYTASGPLYRLALPLSGGVTPADDAAAVLDVPDGEFVTGILTDVPDYGGRGRIIVSRASADGERGRVTLARARWDGVQDLDDADLHIAGGQAGDQAGARVGLLPGWDDGEAALVIASPGADIGASGTGAVAVIQAPR